MQPMPMHDDDDEHGIDRLDCLDRSIINSMAFSGIPFVCSSFVSVILASLNQASISKSG